MGRLKVRNNSGQWIDICDQDIHFRNTINNQWIHFKSGDRVRLPNGNWEQINCIVPICTTETYYMTQTEHVYQRELSTGTGLVQFHVNGTPTPRKFELWYRGELVDSCGYTATVDTYSTSGNLKDTRIDLFNATGEQLEHIGSRFLSFTKNSTDLEDCTLKVTTALINNPNYGSNNLRVRAFCPGVPHASLGKYNIYNNSPSTIRVTIDSALVDVIPSGQSRLQEHVVTDSSIINIYVGSFTGTRTATLTGLTTGTITKSASSGTIHLSYTKPSGVVNLTLTIT